MTVSEGQKLYPLTAQQNSLKPAQHVLPQSQPVFPQSQIAPYAVIGLRARSRPEPIATALPTKAERLMRLRRDRRASRARAVRATSSVVTLMAVEGSRPRSGRLAAGRVQTWRARSTRRRL